MSSSSLPYKAAKEAFVSQLEGGSIYTINVVSFTALTTFTLWAVLYSRGFSMQYGPLDRNQTLQIWLIEFVILFLPIILAVTVLSNHLLLLNGGLLLACTYVYQSHHPTPSPHDAQNNSTKAKKTEKKHWSKRDSDDEESSEGEADFSSGHNAHNGDIQVRRGHARVDSQPIRISVDSAADAALASASPPTTFVPPGQDGNSYSERSSLDSTRASTNSPLLSGRKSSSAVTSASPLRMSSSSQFPAGSPAAELGLVSRQGSSATNGKYVPRNQPFLSVYRAHMMLMTIICILAVDFPVFPREFAKCETWGTSLMDLGVGSFVFSMGIVSALPLLRSPSQRFKPLRAQLLRDARRSAPLFLLGAVRIIMVKGVAYPEHVSEYGVHWNFFITLAMLPFLGTLCRPLARQARYSILGLCLSTSHQIILSSTDLGAWAASNSVARTSFMSQNKEGIVSLPGYLSLFLLGMDLGLYVLPKDPYLAYRKPSKSRRKEKTGKLAMVLASLAILWWLAFYSDVLLLGGRVSRRLANLAYVLWVTAYNTSFLLCYVVVYMSILQPLQGKRVAAEGAEQYMRPSPSSSSASSPTSHDKAAKANQANTPLLLSALNHAAFIVFLLANLLTGLINVSIQTMYSSHLLAVTILTVYTAICLAVATVAYKQSWRLPI